MEIAVPAKSKITNGKQARDESDLVEMRSMPVFWKRWAVSMLAVYPPLVCLVLASRYVLDSTPVVLSLFIIATCLTGLTTGLILPFLNRQLHDWLYQ
ncbi:hypothetical protein [Sulfitobacter litoralis]|jgi:antibiotic biosynthesis monooxygenase (ABM) superfamily enzyme|uniref:hypothetical protein n=1 Tax=Sulfitobacter litoralis TaxID=335975 RepID=UPI000B83371B|nr:hypothetical protein [Sulfitobacter litoralis]GLO80303.1 hypothetical protein MACH23_37240 [Sulfitobacter pontiacus]|tara:strand:+ start:270 stop:560 length:291 start_codon:yes stop_codon:yes gene_type:complete